jgi:hypothetical protein
MRSQCTTNPPQVKTDASYLGIRLSEIGSASDAVRGLYGLAPSAGTADLLLEPTLFAPRSCTHHSSTADHGRTPNTPPPGARIGRRSSIARRAQGPPLSPRATGSAQIGPKGSILDPWGLSPVDGSGLGFRSTIGPAAGLFLGNGLSPIKPLRPTSIHRFATRLMTLPRHTDPRPTAGITRIPGTDDRSATGSSSRSTAPAPPARRRCSGSTPIAPTTRSSSRR